jgi:hypothetical protein
MIGRRFRFRFARAGNQYVVGDTRYSFQTG